MKKLTIVLAVSALTVSANIQAASERSVSRDKVQYSHRVDFEKIQSLKSKGVSQESRIYYKEVSGKELNEGVDIATDADNALVKLTAVKGAAARSALPRVPVDLELLKGGSKRSVGDPSIQMKQTSDALRGAAPKMFKHSEVMRIPGDMGRGRFKLKAKTPVKNNERYMMYVLDQNSDIQLNLNSKQSAYSKGDKLSFNAEVKSSKKVKAVSMNSVLVAPDGRRFPVKSSKSAKGMKGDWKLDIDTKRNPGELWQLEVESTVLNDQQVETKRIAKIALDIHDATAVMNSIETRDGNVNLVLNVQQRGRYEVRALVSGSDAQGQLRPISLTYHADWLESGMQAVEFPIDKRMLENSGLSAPFVVQSVQLLDQSRMAALGAQEGNWPVE